LKRTIISYHGYAESEPQILSRLGFWLTPLLTRLAGQTLCVSNGLLGYIRNHWGASRAKTLRIYNPVLVGGLAALPDVKNMRERPPVVLAAGRLISYKNFHSLVRAFAEVKQPDARLILLGEGPELHAISAEVASLGLQDRVEMPGYVRHPWSYFARARCFVLPSKSESFGLVLVEALGHGLPVVATDCDGPREILADGLFGALVPHDDVPSLTHAISDALADPGDPRPRVERANDFSIPKVVELYEAMFNALITRDPLRNASRSISTAPLQARLPQ
jgi:glycosyltransferase involved in cell wall biosynthesis